MQYFTEYGDTHAEALAKVRSKYGSGPEVLISHQREVPVKTLWGRLTGAKRWEISGAILEKKQTPPRAKDDLIENKLKLLEEMLSRTTRSSRAGAEKESIVRTVEPPAETRLSEAEKIRLRRLEAEIVELRQLLQQQGLPELDPISEREFIALFDYCVAMGFSRDFAANFVLRTRAALPETDYRPRRKVHARACEVLAEYIRTANPSAQRLIAVVGPTGAGKTTTLVKLAVRLSIMGKKKAELVTIDNYRVAATEQLKVYARIMDIPCRVCRTPEELRAVAANSEAEYLLIDTTGTSPSNGALLERQHRFFEALPKHELEVHLVVPAALRLQDTRTVFDTFDRFGFSRIILSKVDESHSFAPVLEVANDWHRSFSLLTNGQDVAKDWLEADKMAMAGMLLKKWLDELDATDRK
ncbi:MAG: hypothetical protein NZL89_03025 [Leptospiraceae bacterium]|nr:hypothetical protein [Leptospiraceae bacterium]